MLSSSLALKPLAQPQPLNLGEEFAAQALAMLKHVVAHLDAASLSRKKKRYSVIMRGWEQNKPEFYQVRLEILRERSFLGCLLRSDPRKSVALVTVISSRTSDLGDGNHFKIWANIAVGTCRHNITATDYAQKSGTVPIDADRRSSLASQLIHKFNADNRAKRCVL